MKAKLLFYIMQPICMLYSIPYKTVHFHIIPSLEYGNKLRTFLDWFYKKSYMTYSKSCVNKQTLCTCFDFYFIRYKFDNGTVEFKYYNLAIKN